MEFGVGSIIEGKVTGITKFGAFVSLPGGRSGLVHISEIAYSYVNDINEHLSVGQTVQVKVIGIDANNRINLMWEDVKGAEIPIPAVIFIVVVIAVGGGIYLFTKYGHDWFRGKPKNGYTKVKNDKK